MMTAMHRGALVLALAWALAAPASLGDEVPAADLTFRIRQAGEVVGFQRVQVQARGDTRLLTAEARVALNRSPVPWQAREQAELDAATRHPHRYRLEQADGLVRSDTEAVFADRVAAITRQI